MGQSSNGQVQEAYRFASFAELFDFDPTSSARSLRRQYQLIQEAKRLRNARGGGPIETETEEAEHSLPKGLTVDEAKDEWVRLRIEEARPEESWKSIADSLGLSKKTLYVYRRRVFPQQHRHYPDT